MSADKPLTDAERLLGQWQRGEIPVDVLLTFVAERERAAREEGRAESDAEWAAAVEGLTADGMTDAGDCCSDYCVADVHDLRLDQAERLEELLRALLTADRTKALDAVKQEAAREALREAAADMVWDYDHDVSRSAVRAWLQGRAAGIGGQS